MATKQDSTRNIAPIPILTYHQIAQAGLRGTPYRSLCVAPDDFGKQMRFLRTLGYQGLSMSALFPYLMGEKQGKVVGITFDDGYLNNLTHALPVLQTIGFSSTCYVVSQRIGQTNLWDAEFGVAPSPLMNEQQLNRWVAGGQEIGAHTRTHAHLLQLNDEQCRDEIAQCKSELESIVGVPVQHFCYPYGEYAERHSEQARLAGFTSTTTTQRSRCVAGENLMQLPRVPVLRTTTLLALWLKLATRYEDRRRA